MSYKNTLIGHQDHLVETDAMAVHLSIKTAEKMMTISTPETMMKTSIMIQKMMTWNSTCKPISFVIRRIVLIVFIGSCSKNF